MCCLHLATAPPQNTCSWIIPPSFPQVPQNTSALIIPVRVLATQSSRKMFRKTSFSTHLQCEILYVHF